MTELHEARTIHVSQSARTVGLWSAVVATVCSVSYVLGQLAEWLGWLGSRGGPESTSTPLGIVLLLTPSLLLEPFRFVPFDSFLYAVDILGYSFMSLATLFAARVLAGSKEERLARRFLTANGLLLPFIALQMYTHPLIWIASLWAVTFPGATWTLAVYFSRLRLAPVVGGVSVCD
jgi:hypothetical protein